MIDINFKMVEFLHKLFFKKMYFYKIKLIIELTNL